MAPTAARQSLLLGERVGIEVLKDTLSLCHEDMSRGVSFTGFEGKTMTVTRGQHDLQSGIVSAGGLRIRIGVISDTHGLLRPEAVRALRGSDVILHAGDVCGAHVVEELRAIAPVTAVRGNNDRDPWGRGLPPTATLELEGVRIHVLHSLADLDLDPTAEGVAVVVSGHSHQPLRQRRKGVLYLNPGSAGPRRFRLPITLARLTVRAGRATARIVTLSS
jgi:putative phosphoesterase